METRIEGWKKKEEGVIQLGSFFGLMLSEYQSLLSYVPIPAEQISVVLMCLAFSLISGVWGTRWKLQ